LKIAIIGSTAYQDKMNTHKTQLKKDGHTILMPNFDKPSKNELEICEGNRQIIEDADEVHLIWDGRSIGAIFDIGMVFALRKPLIEVFIQPKSFRKFVEQYVEPLTYGDKKEIEQQIKDSKESGDYCAKVH